MLEKEILRRMYQRMKITRILEEQLMKKHAEGMIRGPVHLCLGQEAVGVGACAVLNDDDYVTSTHRGHAHFIGKGLDINKMVAEMMGKKTGYCKGKGGHMLIADVEKGMVGGCGIVGGGIPISVGYGLAFRMQKTKRVALCFFGDGASNEGNFHESLNLAAIWKVNTVFFAENNLYGLTVPASKHLSIVNIAERSKAYGIPGIVIDGNDILAVYEATKEAVVRARRGDGPTLIEAKTYRILGFSTGDQGGYQPKEEISEWKGKDPIERFKKYLIDKDILEDTEIEKMNREAKKMVDNAIKFGIESPYPEKESAFTNIYANN